MTKRFDALLFDAGGIFLVPDPLTTGMVLEPFGGSTSLSVLVRCHYAGMAAIDAATALQAADSIERISWSSYREAYAREAGVPENRVDDAARACSKFSRHFVAVSIARISCGVMENLFTGYSCWHSFKCQRADRANTC